jgi:alanine-synthesizing transaminase
MMFSQRAPSSLASNRLAQAVARRCQSGLPLFDLTASNPTRAGIEYPSDLLTPLGDSRALTYAPSPLGLVEARRSVSADYARRGADVSAERIVLTASSSEAYSLLFKLLADAGDEVLIPRPSYPLFEHLTCLEAVVPRFYDIEYHGVWSLDLSSVERALTPRTRAIVIVSPNNPTGSFVTADEVDRLACVCGPLQIPLIADEVFADYDLEPDPARRAPSVAGRRDVVAFALGGLSKSVGLPQVKLGWIAVGGGTRSPAPCSSGSSSSPTRIFRCPRRCSWPLGTCSHAGASFARAFAVVWPPTIANCSVSSVAFRPVGSRG